MDAEVRIDATVVKPRGKRLAYGFPNTEYEYIFGPRDGDKLIAGEPFCQVDLSIAGRWIGSYYPGNADEKRAVLIWCPAK